MFTKSFIFLLAIILFIGCSAKQQAVKAPAVVDEPEMLVGDIDYEDILLAFPQWKSDDEGVSADGDQIAALKGVSKSLTIICFLGTWCGDSRRGVPPFYRTLEKAANPEIKLQMIGVDRDKVDPEFKALDAGIERVPTFIIMEGGQEIGRFVEFPEGDNFAADLIQLLED